MILTLLLLAIVGSAATAVVRRRLAADAGVPDSRVLTVDVVGSAVTIILFGVAAIVAATTGPLDGAMAVTVKVVAVLAAAGTGASLVRLVLEVGGIPTRGDNHDDEPDAPLRGGRIIGTESVASAEAHETRGAAGPG